MKILVINMDRNPERLANMCAQFGGLGLDFERFAAVDGRAVDPAGFQEFRDRLRMG